MNTRNFDMIPIEKTIKTNDQLMTFTHAYIA